MATNEEIQELKDAAALKSVSSGGESATYDNAQLKAELRDARNNNLENIANGRVRPVMRRLRFYGVNR